MSDLERKDLGAVIVTILASAGVLAPAAWLATQMAGDVIDWLRGKMSDTEDELQAVSEAQGTIAELASRFPQRASQYASIVRQIDEVARQIQREKDAIDTATERAQSYEERSAPNLNETKSFADIMNFLYAAGIVFVGGTMIWDRRDAIMGRIEEAIDAVRDSITYLRFGTEMEDLQKVIIELQSAGIQVPARVQAIVDNPVTGDAGGGPASNLEYARGWLETTLRLLQEARDRAESMPDDGMDKSAPAVKSAGAHSFYR